ncbi:MAG: hypothetical protein LBB48_08095 [Treponema sp.]|jgi:DNA modification methylase|nr:hypothetical protein [Treponema sp.]
MLEIVVMEINTSIFQGDAGEILQNIQENTVDLIVTSPPYADQRKDTYGGIPADKYVEWFLPISEELFGMESTSDNAITYSVTNYKQSSNNRLTNG